MVGSVVDGSRRRTIIALKPFAEEPVTEERSEEDLEDAENKQKVPNAPKG